MKIKIKKLFDVLLAQVEDKEKFKELVNGWLRNQSPKLTTIKPKAFYNTCSECGTPEIICACKIPMQEAVPTYKDPQDKFFNEASCKDCGKSLYNCVCH